MHNDINVDFEDIHLIENDCIVCNFPESFVNCPSYSVGYHSSLCGHFESCKTGSCSCNQLEKMTSFLNLSKSTIKRHRRQQIESPSSDFGIEKARAATKKKIKDSMRPFDNENDINYKAIPATELFSEFINMMKGRFKKDMLEYIIREAKTLPIIDIDFQKEQRTYTKTELDKFLKDLNFDPCNFELDQLLTQCQNFILNEPIISCEKPILEKDLPNKAMEIDLNQQELGSEYVENVDLEREIKQTTSENVVNNNISNATFESPEAICAKYASRAVHEIERCELILRTNSDTLSATLCCNDSGSNIQMISIQNYVKMGGDKKNVKKIKSNIENSSGHNTLVIGEVYIELYAVQETTLLYFGKHKFIVIDNPSFNEVLLGMSCLHYFDQKLERQPVTSGQFVGLTCPKGKQGKFYYTSNCPSYRIITATKDKALKANKKCSVAFCLPLSVAEYVFCSDEITHTSFYFNSVNINPNMTHKKLGYKDITRIVKVDMNPLESYHIKAGDDIPNTLGFPNHYDCSCRNDQDDLYIASECYYTEQQGVMYQGHAVMEQSLEDMNVKMGINIDEIAKQPMGDEDVLGHLDLETQQIIRGINNKHKKAFNTPEDPIGKFNAKQFEIEFIPGSTFYQPPLNLKGERGVALDNEIKKLLRVGVIEKATGAGECNIPAFAVGKAKGKALLAQTLGKQQKTYDSYRMVLDMRQANSKMIGHGGVLLPSQDDLLTRMQCAKYVAVADVSSAFHALEYTDDTAKRMRFSHRGTHYIFKRVIMGALPSSQMLEQAMNSMFSQNEFEEFLKNRNYDILQLRDYLLIYCDDIIIGTPTKDQFYLVYEFLLQQISKYGVKLELKKLKILQPSTTILGYDFSREPNGTMTHCIKQSKVDQFLGLPTPKSKRMLSSYLSASAIYFKNIIGVKLLMSPLYLFLRSESNKFEHCHFRALSMLRLMMSLNLKQACMNSDKILCILSDSSMTASHGIVAQFQEVDKNVEIRPIMCSSKMFDKAGIRQPSIYKEMMGVLSITKQAEHLIRANKAGTFIISDCRPLALGLRARSTTIGLAEAAIYLSSLPRLRILHLRGSEIRACDVYSRLFSFGLASKERFNKDTAMTFKSEFFGNMTYTVGDLERVIQNHEDANYLQLSPIKPGKLTTSDFYAKICEEDNETQYFRGLFKGFEYIDKSHSFWKPAIKNPQRDYVTEAEFNAYVASGTFKEFRDQLDSLNISNDKVFYTFHKEGITKAEAPALFVSRGHNLKFVKNENKLTLQVTLDCPPDCHRHPVPGPQVFLKSDYGELKTSETDNFDLFTSISEFEDKHGYYDTLYKCRLPHKDRKVWELEVNNCQDEPLCVKTISHYSIPTDQGARLISDRISQALCSKLTDIDLSHLGHGELWDSNKCQLPQPIIDCFNNNKIGNNELTSNKGPLEKSNKNYGKESNQQLNLTAIMSLLMIAQASHFGSGNFTGFLLEMQQNCPPIQDILKKIESQNKDQGKEVFHKRYSFSLDKSGLMWASQTSRNACRLVVPTWFISILIKNLHSGAVHLSSLGMTTLISRTFLMVDDELIPARISRDPFNLPTENKKQINKLCIEAEKQCIKCILARPSTVKSMSGSQRHLETEKAGAVLSLDLLEGLPKTSGTNYTCILVAVDRASSFSIALPQLNTTAAETLRNFQSIYSIIGPNLIAIETDGSVTFTKVTEYCCSRGVAHKRYGPRSEVMGVAEGGIRIVRKLLDAAVFNVDTDSRRYWDCILPEVMHTLNNIIVKPGVQNFTRRELFWNKFCNSAEMSGVHVKNVYEALQKLRSHREKSIRKLANLETVPQVKIGDLVVLKRRKTEITTQTSGTSLKKTRAFIPPTGAQLYRIVATNELFCRLNSVLDNSFRTVAKNKITHLDIDEWIETSHTIPGLLSTLYRTHKFIPGYSTRPAMHKLRKHGYVDGEEVQNHIDNCRGTCTLLKDVPMGLIFEDDLEDDQGESTQVGAEEILAMEPEISEEDQSGTGANEEPELDEPQLSVLTPDDEQQVVQDREQEEEQNEFRRITRSMRKQTPQSFYQCLLHSKVPDSAVLTFTHILRLSTHRQQKSILSQSKKNRIKRNVTFADHCLVTTFSTQPGSHWISTLHSML